jgi:5-methyltetrahydropteroyltriglutamate--homocysteine methyltransferase
MPQTLLPTSLVGSYPRPDWLIDRPRLAGRLPPRVGAHELWRAAPGFLEQAQDDVEVDEAEMAMDCAAAVNEEIRDLFAAGADIVQIDEPHMEARPEKARQHGVEAVNRARGGITGTTALHIGFGYAAIIHEPPSGDSFLPEPCQCRVKQISIETAQSNLAAAVLEALPGQAIILGVIDLSDRRVESPETVAARIRRALPHGDPARVIVAPDCGMTYLAREVAEGKLHAMVEGAAMARRELAGRA